VTPDVSVRQFILLVGAALLVAAVATALMMHASESAGINAQFGI
jgi:hypothetical protein